MNKPFMDWHDRYMAKKFIRTSFCLIPISAIVAALTVAPVIRWIDGKTQWILLDVGVEGARALVGNLPSSLLSLIVFSLGMILVAVQLASSQYTSRIIARVFEASLPLKAALGIFVFSYAYSLFALGRIEDRAPELPVALALLSSLISLALFLYIIEIIGHSFRPIKIIGDVAADTKKVVEAMYPRPYLGPREASLEQHGFLGKPCRTIRNHIKAGTFVAFDQAGIVELAARNDCVVEIAVAPGEFIAEEQIFFRVYGAGGATLDEKSLNRCVVIAVERKLDQDPSFGFRIIVDVASKALSPAINDPTTGVLAIDQIQHLLALIGQRQLDAGIVKDPYGVVRLSYPSCDWEDYVAMGVTEIRLYGGPNPQVTRRLQAMYDYLMQVLPEPRQDAIRKERALLGKTVEESFGNNEDRTIAATSDYLGFGACRDEK